MTNAGKGTDRSGAARKYRFLLPNVQKKIIGSQGEQARFIPYRLEEGVTPESILRELRRQPHMKALAEALDGGRRLYLLEGPDIEQLLLAAEYIGTYHRLINGMDECYTVQGDWDASEEDEDDGGWRDGDINERVFNFETGMPVLTEWELNQFYSPSEGFGFGDQMYRPDAKPQKRPWWTLSCDAPMAVSLVDPENGNGFGILSALPRLVENLRERSLLIVLSRREKKGGDGEIEWVGGPDMTMEDVGFELETDYIRLEAPKIEGRYKAEVLRQLAWEKGVPLARSVSALKILSLIEERRGDTRNKTISKAVANALLRRKSAGSLTAGDFAYLASVFPRRGEKRGGKETSMELVGQEAVRRQLQSVVESMAFQRRRKAMGLSCAPIHYTFAFMGAPGTGKTTWAKWLAAVMERRALLSDTSCICINAAELKAKYVGHTTGKVKALFQQHGVIILDEAYSLAEGDDSFGREALAQLCVELEEHAEDRLVIFAGYGGSKDPGENRMLRFLQSNPGINSRVSFKIQFQDFEPAELTEVFRSMLAWEQYTLPREALAAAEEFFRKRAAQKAFGNCREARNLADRVKVQAALRLSEETVRGREQVCRILTQDVEGAAADILEEYRALEREAGRTIGFG